MNGTSSGGQDKSRDGSATQKPTHNANSTRETVESIAVAVILAFLFRGFVAEAFVIPTGSMAPTLQGNHKDVVCAKCGLPYQAGASVENDDQLPNQREVVLATTCPICRYTMDLDWNKDANHKTFTGDRILVSKFSYELGEPQRWDVIVFKFPNNAKQNYIKRLIGLPGETVRIFHGDIYVRTSDDQPFVIARKPPEKVLAMLQVVDDTQHVPADLAEKGWHSRWQPWTANRPLTRWRPSADDKAGIQIDAGAEPVWYRYRHLLPRPTDWAAIERGNAPEMRPPGNDAGQLITDFCPYNAYTTDSPFRRTNNDLGYDPRQTGMHWVGDLAVEGDVKIESDSGTLWLDLVESGEHFRAELDVATGEARLEQRRLDGSVVELAKSTAGATGIKGKGTHQVRLANVDDQLCLWVNGYLVQSANYEPPAESRPVWNGDEDPLDLAPAGVGGHDIQCLVQRVAVYRDAYYVATRNGLGDFDYPDQIAARHGPMNLRTDAIPDILSNPRKWASTSLFAARQEVRFRLEKDQFFPLGDNSPQSQDGRLWGNPPYVERKLLTGKALMVYWPHYWNSPIRFTPNFSRMRLIH